MCIQFIKFFLTPIVNSNRTSIANIFFYFFCENKDFNFSIFEVQIVSEEIYLLFELTLMFFITMLDVVYNIKLRIVIFE